jgi:hypothetical protein
MDSYKELTLAVSIYYENPSGKKSIYLNSNEAQVCVWRSKFVDHSAALDFLFRADSALRCRVHQDVRHCLRLSR